MVRLEGLGSKSLVPQTAMEPPRKADLDVLTLLASLVLPDVLERTRCPGGESLYGDA